MANGNGVKKREYKATMEKIQQMLGRIVIPRAFNTETTLMNFDINSDLENLRIAVSSAVLYMQKNFGEAKHA